MLPAWDNKKVCIPTATISSQQISNMELYDSEETCSSVSFTLSEFPSSVDSQESSVDSYPKLPSNAVLNKKKYRKRIPHILDKLYYRELRGNFVSRPRAANLSLFCQIPSRCQIRLRNVLPESALDSNHVFLGLSRCGQFLLSYTYTTELDVMTFNQVYKYRLHWWAFVPHQQVRKVSEVMLFGNQGVYSTLFIAVCQWPMDYSRILIYGNCQESYGQLTGTWGTSPPERSYLTITTVPSLNKCQDCLKVAASYEEEDLAASWDSCVRFSCLKHGLTVHTSFDVVSPFPKFEPTICMKREGTVVFNTGNFLHALRAELEHLSSAAVSKSYTTSETLDQNPSTSDKQELTDTIGSEGNTKLDDGDQETSQNSRVYDTRSRTILQRKQALVQQSPTDLAKCSASPLYESNGDVSSTKQDGASNCIYKNVTVSATSLAHKNRAAKVIIEEEDFDDDIEDETGASDEVNSQIFFTTRGNRNLLEQDLERAITPIRNGSDENFRIGLISRDITVSKSSEMSASHSRPTIVKVNGRYSEKVLDSTFNKDSKTGYCTRDLEALSIRERIVRDFRDGVFSGRITRSQTSRGRVEMTDISAVEEITKMDTEKIKKSDIYVSEKFRYAGGESFWKEQSDFIGIGNKESRIMDSTQELNITCGSTNPTTSDEIATSITLMSPIPGTLLMVNTTEESESDDCQSNPERRKEMMTPSSSRSRRIRGGATVKLSSPLPALPATPPRSVSTSNTHNKIAEAEKAYEFTDDGLEPGCEKLSSFRRRRLADKKYEFCEEGEDAENIVPFRLTRRRELSPRLRSPPIYLAPSPLMLSHRRRHHDTLSDTPELITSGPRSPQILSSDIHTLTTNPNHMETDKVVLRPLNRNTNTALLLSPRDRDGTADWVKTNNNNNNNSNNNNNNSNNNNRKLPEHNSLEKPEHNLLDNGTVQQGNLASNRMSRKELPNSSLPSNGNSSTRCTVQLKRRYIEVDDELVSVITDIEDDDFSESTGYHCALPLEVHGAAYAQLQMISNTKAGKLMAPCVLVHQRSFDVEQFCHEIAERLCIEAGKKYWFCNDYDVEIVDVCPFSGDVIAVALMRIQATIKTKGLAKSQRHPVSSMERQQYQGSCKFVWNVDTGHYAVVWTRALHEVDQNDTIDMDPWNPARDLAVKLRKDIQHVPMFQSVKTITNELVLRGVPLVRISDLENLTELTL